MKYKGVKYKRFVTEDYIICSVCDVPHYPADDTENCPNKDRCRKKDIKKGNLGFYKEV